MADVLIGFHQCTFYKSNTEFNSDLAPCSTYWRSGWSIVRSASLTMGGTLKKRPSPHLHKVPTQSN